MISPDFHPGFRVRVLGPQGRLIGIHLIEIPVRRINVVGLSGLLKTYSQMIFDSISGLVEPSSCGQPNVGTRPRGLSLRKLFVRVSIDRHTIR
jgi:hypothetical protein